MTKRKKRLAKGIESLQEQVRLHEEKKARAEEDGLIELRDYYEKEILAKKRTLEEKQKMLDKQ